MTGEVVCKSYAAVGWGLVGAREGIFKSKFCLCLVVVLWSLFVVFREREGGKESERYQSVGPGRSSTHF